MARWDPPANVDNNEHLGRRLFDEPMLTGTSDQPSFAGLLLTHFEENRGNEYSLDRLGRSSVDRKVISYLKPRAQTAGNTFRKPNCFNGWAVLPARHLLNARRPPSLAVIASPIYEAAPNDNIYHAHVLRPNSMDPTHMALHLRHLFTNYGTVETVLRERRGSRLAWFLSLPIINRFFNGPRSIGPG
jgi:hypothetical protein